MSPKRQRILETWRETLRRIADKLPDHPLDPPQEEDDDPEESRGESIPDLTTSHIPEN